MTKMLSFAAILVAALAVLTTACKKDESTTCTTTGLTYNKDIKTLLAGCAISGCHNAGSNDGSLANYSDTKDMVADGAMLGAVKHQSGYDAMPQGSAKWDDCKISQLEAWITAGMPEQ